jgi:hypothetical protein
MKPASAIASGVGVLRPWPYGPPLRGRAPHPNAGRAVDPGDARRHVRDNRATASAVETTESEPSQLAV